MGDFISEDNLLTFEGFLKYQAVDPAMLTPDELAMWRGYYYSRRTVTDMSGFLRSDSGPANTILRAPGPRIRVVQASSTIHPSTSIPANPKMAAVPRFVAQDSVSYRFSTS